MGRTSGARAAADDISRAIAWQEGRRVYVRAEYGTPLAQAMFDLGATWDPQTRARWVGVVRKQSVIDAVRSTAPQPLAEDIPVDTAWRHEDTIYIRSRPDSQVARDLHGCGVRPYSDFGVTVPAAHVDIVAAVLRGHIAFRAERARVLALGLWQAIPFEENGIRERAKVLGAHYHQPGRTWAFPTEEARAEIRALLDAQQLLGDDAPSTP